MNHGFLCLGDFLHGEYVDRGCYLLVSLDGYFS